MKKLRKILLIVLAVLVVLIGTAIALPFLYKDNIVRYIQDDVNKNLNAEVKFDEDISINIFRSFPKIHVGIENTSVIGKGQFAADTLFQADRIGLNIDLMDVIRNNKINIGYLEVIQPDIRLISTPTGANWDVMKENSSEEESSVSLSTAFKKAILQNANFSYVDTAANVLMDLRGITGNFTGSFVQDSFDLTSTLSCDNALISYENIPYVNNIALKADAITAINLATDKYYFKENSFYVGNLLLTGQGGMQFDENGNMNFDLVYGSKNAGFDELMSLIPAYYRSDLEGMKATGIASVDGSLKGLLSENSFPGYHLDLLLEDGRLEHKSLTNAFDRVNLDLHVENQDGEDNSLVINLKKLNLLYQNEPVAAHMLLKTLYTDPYVDGGVKGKLRLEDVMTLTQTDESINMSGNVDADVNFKGYYSSIENEKYEDFNSSGRLLGTNIVYDQKDQPKVEIDKTEIDFTSHKLNIPVLQARSGKSDVNLNGAFDNLFGFVLNNENLTGQMTVSSNFIDLDAFDTEASIESNDTATYLAVEIPGNLDVGLTYNLNELKYGRYTLNELVGSSRIADQSLLIDKLTTRFMGGMISFNGLFNAKDANNPFTDINITIQDLQVQDIFGIKTVKILAPIAEYVTGKFSSTIHLKTDLMSDLSPNLKNITCEGVLDLFNCDVSGLKSVNQIAQKLQYDELSKPFNIKDLLLSFSIKDGKINVAPFDLPIGETKLNIGGYSTLDKMLHFDGLLTVPKQLYLSHRQGIDQYIPSNQLNKIDSIDFKNIELAVNIGGEFLKPKVSLAYEAMSTGIKDQLKSRIKDEANKRKEELQQKATEEINRAKEEAERARREAEAEAKKALEEQKRKMQEQLDREKEATKKKAQEELDKKKKELIKDKIPGFPK